MQLISEYVCFEGRQLRYQHFSDVLNCDMFFSVFVPPQAKHESVPVIYWLSGLTCTDENFVSKAGAQQYAALHGVALVIPDTSPRGEMVPDDPQGDWDFGLGAGFYVNATEKPWAEHYKMYDYILYELPVLIATEFAIDLSRQAISGHSMGGHGALVLGLRNPDRFCSISAFAPICSPMNSPWGQKAFTHYLSADQTHWKHYDACALIKKGAPTVPLRVDQGGADNFLASQLKPELLIQACQEKNYPLAFHLWPGYDHSYFFIASKIADHIQFHAKQLKSSQPKEGVKK